jgi:hypothetical protein
MVNRRKLKHSLILVSPPPINRDRLYSFLVLILLLIITFSPLFLGKNFIPFERYPQWSFMPAESSGQQFRVPPTVKRLIETPWTGEPEFGSLGINWTDNLYFAHILKQWKLPLWDPYLGGGVPTLDNGQSRPFNPFRLPFYLFPTSWTYSLTLLAGLVFGGIGAYLWLSKQGLSPAPVTLGTGLFVLNPWVLDRLVLTDTGAYFVLPWCLLTLEQTSWRNWPSIARAILCFVLMGQCGHPEVSMIMAGVACVVYLSNRRNSMVSYETLSQKAKIIGVVAVFTSLCLAVLWLPLLKLLIIGDLYKSHVRFIYQYSWKSLIILPSDMFVAPAIGVVLVFTLLAWKRLPKIWLILLAILLLILFPLPWMGTRLSILVSNAGLPAFYLKGVVWASFSFLAPYGLEVYRISKRGRAFVAVFVVGGGMMAMTGLQFILLQRVKSQISSFPAIAFLLFALGLVGLMAFHNARGKLIPAFMSAIILLPLAYPLSLNKLFWNRIDFRTNPVVEWLKASRPEARVASVDFGGLFAIPPNLGQAYGIRCAEIAAVIFLNHYRSISTQPKTLPTAVLFDSLSSVTLSQMGVTVVLLSNDVSSSKVNLLYKGSLYSAYAIPGAHGRLYFAEKACHYKLGLPFLRQILSISQETDAVAIVEDMGHTVPAVIPHIPSGMGTAVFEGDEIDNIVIRTECPSEGLLVLRDSWYPGWMATVDGKKVPVLRVNGCYRGVIVPAGEHRVRFVYRPILVYASGAVSLLTALFVVSVSLRRRSTQGIELAVGQRSKVLTDTIS